MEIKLCKDCYFHYRWGNIHSCNRDVKDEIDLVTGDTYNFGTLRCYEERESDEKDRCGRKGRYFKAKDC